LDSQFRRQPQALDFVLCGLFPRPLTLFAFGVGQCRRFTV